jgi:hypothetical protein
MFVLVLPATETVVFVICLTNDQLSLRWRRTLKGNYLDLCRGRTGIRLNHVCSQQSESKRKTADEGSEEVSSEKATRHSGRVLGTSLNNNVVSHTIRIVLQETAASFRKITKKIVKSLHIAISYNKSVFWSEFL